MVAARRAIIFVLEVCPSYSGIVFVGDSILHLAATRNSGEDTSVSACWAPSSMTFVLICWSLTQSNSIMFERKQFQQHTGWLDWELDVEMQWRGDPPVLLSDTLIVDHS
ncbi:hypothetical protein ACFX2I_016158 [Malus domestica]